MKQANDLLMRGDVIRISKDEPRLYSAEMKATSDESNNILVSIETDEEGDVIEIYCNCSCDDIKPCAHVAATLMGWWLMDSLECDDIQRVFDILSMQE